MGRFAIYSEEEKRERKKIHQKKWREKNKEKEKEYHKEWGQTPAGKKTNIIARWKIRGLICENYNSLYIEYINRENCEECNVKFGEIGDGTGRHRCMDHDHETGEFRNFLCCSCNIKRG